MRWPWQRREAMEQRAVGSGFTAEGMQVREAFVTGRRGLGEMTATVQSCVSLWEAGFAAADVEGTDLLTRRMCALAGRMLALRGEVVFLIGDRGLVVASDWDVRTRHGEPTAYRLSLPDAGGGTSHVALAGEVLHVVIGANAATPWAGTAPLRRAALTAELMHAVEAALRDVWENAPIGSTIVPFPESPDTNTERLSSGFRGRRGSVLLRESVNVTAAGGPAPVQDWRPNDLTPDLSRALAPETLASARGAIGMAYGVLPALLNQAATGPVVREAQRHLAQWTLSPIANLIAEEATTKLGVPVRLDLERPLQAFDAGGRARAVSAMVKAFAEAKAAGLDDGIIASAMNRVDWAA